MRRSEHGKRGKYGASVGVGRVQRTSASMSFVFAASRMPRVARRLPDAATTINGVTPASDFVPTSAPFATSSWISFVEPACHIRGGLPY